MLEQTFTQPAFTKTDKEEIYDVVIIGAGPAGMSAAVCAGRAMLKTLLIDKALPGGQTATAYKIDNYLGFPQGILGSDLSTKMEDQLRDHNVEFACEYVEDIGETEGGAKIVKTDLGTNYKTRTVIVAPGLEPKKLDNELERKFLGRGISYYAQCDVDYYKGKDVAVLGGGNCACYAADYLADHVNKLYLIHRSDQIKAVKSLKEKVLSNPRIIPMWNSQVVDIFGLDKVEKIKLENVINRQYTWIDVKVIFVYVGRIPPKQILSLDLQVDEQGFIITDQYMRTNKRGIYAAGDIRSKQIRQIATAVSDGMIAAINVARELSEK